MELPNGKLLRDLIFHTEQNVLVIRDGKMLLVRQYRTVERLLGKFQQEVDSKEEVPLEAAKRELEEETNLAAEEWVKMMEMVSTLDSAMKNYIIPSKNIKENAKPADEDEFVEILWMPLEEVMQKNPNG